MILSGKRCVDQKVNLVFPISAALGNAGPLLPVSTGFLGNCHSFQLCTEPHVEGPDSPKVSVPTRRQTAKTTE